MPKGCLETHIHKTQRVNVPYIEKRCLQSLLPQSHDLRQRPTHASQMARKPKHISMSTEFPKFIDKVILCNPIKNQLKSLYNTTAKTQSYKTNILLHALMFKNILYSARFLCAYCCVSIASINSRQETIINVSTLF